MSCYAAGYDGFWLHRLLCGHGIDNRVLDAASILVDRRFRRGKTDRLDVAALLRTLMALERGEPRVCREVRAPSVEQEDERRRSRERARLVSERGQHLNRIKGLLMTQGVRDFAPGRRDWRKRLDGLRTADGRELPHHLRQEIERECRRLWLVVEMIAAVEAEQQQAAKAGETTGDRKPGGAIEPPARRRPDHRQRACRRSLLQRLQESPRTRRLFRPRLESLEQRRGEPRSRACRLRQSPSAADSARIGLAVAAPSARQRACAMVP